MYNNKDFNKFAIEQNNITSTSLDSYSKYMGKMRNSVTPYVIEERQLNVTQLDVFSRLMMDRIIWISGPVEDRMASIIQAQMLFLDKTDKKDIKMHINTPGGSVLAGLGIVDVMSIVNSDIETINTGMCASMGSVLLAAGTKGKRTSLNFSKVMTHQVSHGSQGNVQDTRINQEQAEKYNYILFKKLAEYSGKTFQEVMEFSERDRWYTSDEAKEFGLIDHVLLGDNEKSISELLEGFNDYYKEKMFSNI